MQGYDIIGDLHGCARDLKGLLSKLGYAERDGAYRHAEYPAVFVGDLIDRGDEQLATLKLVKAMVDAESAQVVMGNHEFNAIAYATPRPDTTDEFLRPHNEKNKNQHRKFLEQVATDPEIYAEYIEWFRSFPVYLDLGDVRVVHACWGVEAIERVSTWIERDALMTLEFLVRANTKGTEEHSAIEVLLKGPELSLAEYGQPAFRDKDGHVRQHARIRWWDGDAHTLRQLAEIPPGAQLAGGGPFPVLPDVECADGVDQYRYRDDVPVFYGHYWRTWAPAKGEDWTTSTACVDFSAVKGGPLVAYRWKGERVLSASGYVEFSRPEPNR